MSKPNTQTLRAMRVGERRVFVAPHNADKNMHVTAGRLGISISTRRAWLVPQHGAPEACVILKCLSTLRTK